MEVKLFEVRDKGAFIAVIAIKPGSRNEAERYLMARSGYGPTYVEHENYVLLARLDGGGKLTYDPYEHGNARTMAVAHDRRRDRRTNDLRRGSRTETE